MRSGLTDVKCTLIDAAKFRSFASQPDTDRPLTTAETIILTSDAELDNDDSNPATSQGPTTLLFETSPYGLVDAIVQHDGRSVYFYLNGRGGSKFGTRACWVRNLALGPLVLNEQELRSGVPPMLPRTETVQREPQPLPHPNDLLIVWLEEGNGAALLERQRDRQSVEPAANLPTATSAAVTAAKTATTENESSSIATIESLAGFETLAVIPPWSGLEGFHGYARESATENQLCWPLPANPKLAKRIEQAHEFWRSFYGDHDPLIELQKRLLEQYQAHRWTAGAGEPHYYSIGGQQFPPRGLAEYHLKDRIVLLTVGLSLCPQPAVELAHENPQHHRRIELGIVLPQNSPTSTLERVRAQLSGLTSYPWTHFTWLGAGHTCGFPELAAGCNTAVLVADEQLQSEVSETDVNAANVNQADVNQANSSRNWNFEFRGDRVNLLWLIPLTETQQRAAGKSTEAIAEFAARWQARQATP